MQRDLSCVACVCVDDRGPPVATGAAIEHLIGHKHLEACGLCDECARALALIVAELQRANDLAETATGMPKADPLIIQQASPGQNVKYVATPFSQPVTIRTIMVSTSATAQLSLWLASDHYAGGYKLLWTGAVGGNTTVALPFRLRAGQFSAIAISTGSNSATFLDANIYYDYEPTTPQEQYVGRF